MRSSFLIGSSLIGSSFIGSSLTGSSFTGSCLCSCLNGSCLSRSCLNQSWCRWKRWWRLCERLSLSTITSSLGGRQRCGTCRIGFSSGRTSSS
ncbi:pentapeptide repeat-containing protein [Nonomuraea antimicrobica]